MFRRFAVAAIVLAAVTAGDVRAQMPSDMMRTLYRTGPRVGITFLGGALVDSLKSRYGQEARPVISQFGWQYERQFATLENGPVALNEFILLVGGLDQGIAIPSFTWLVGVRTPGQFEIGVGPNATPAGVSLAMSVGQTFRSGGLNVPVNVAIVPSKFGTRASVMTGFNIYR